MPEPDIPPIRLAAEDVEKERANLSKMPIWYRQEFGQIISHDQLETLLDYPTLMQKLAELGDNTAVKKIANLFSSVLLAEENTSLLNDELPSREQLLRLVAMLNASELSSTGAKEVFLKFFDPEMHYKDTDTIAKELGVVQQNDLGALEAIVDTVLAKPETAQAQADFKAGQEKVLGFLVGQVMKESRGQANPSAVQDILRQKLS